MFGLRGKGSVSLSAGQQVEVTGVMKTIGTKTTDAKQVFLVRTVRAGGRVYTIRNRRGFPITPEARERANRKTAQKREAL
jgi:hypothetical protein